MGSIFVLTFQSIFGICYFLLCVLCTSIGMPRSVAALNSTPCLFLRGNTSPSFRTAGSKCDYNGSSANLVESVGIVGGGLAGLSTAYHLLQQSRDQPVHVTILDQCSGPGQGGASSVAAGLLHPFSPRGKLIHLGLDGLRETNTLLNEAIRYEPKCVLRNHIYRVALTQKHVTQLEKAANEYPDYATWMDKDEMRHACGSSTLFGGLRLTNGCKAIHVPSYLDGLWRACQDISGGTIKWCTRQLSAEDGLTKNSLREFDAVIFSAGSGLFESSLLSRDSLPIDLVRGQAIQLNLKQNNGEDGRDIPRAEAVLCGKYMTPLLEPNKILVGATQEFKAEKLSESLVIKELRQKTYELLPIAWELGQVGKLTCGTRVQSRRGKNGRMPIVGKLKCCDFHPNAWLFTGLSSRGLIYHGIYGKLLSTSILQGNEDNLVDVLWWRE